ncbi:hypothetical protein T484DRAFT_1862279 [Baffinella frigidus]|nr:hypothetical protein T484DRAFT_1862279 [Cryptophyta sp. CCMP2293]
MTLMSCFCDKTNNVLSRMRPSVARSCARQGSRSSDRQGWTSCGGVFCLKCAAAAVILDRQTFTINLSQRNASLPAQQSTSDDTDAMPRQLGQDSSFRRQYMEDTDVSSERKDATPLNEWLSLGPVNHSKSAFSNKRENCASRDPSGSVQELASDASQGTEGSTNVAPRRRATSVDSGIFPSAQAVSFRGRLLGSSDPSSQNRYAAVSGMIDLFDTARSERYNAVEGMLTFLDVQAERRGAP